MQKNNISNRIIQACGFTGLIGLSSFIKLSFIIGSHISFFSGANIIAPLSGTFGGVSGSIGFWFMRHILYYCLLGTLTIKNLFIGIPTLFASLYLSTHHWLIRVALPVSCMFLFWMHPVGFGAAAYALYWIIPVVVHFLSRKYFFFEALGSTFIAHAIGSVIWLYTTSMTPAMWLTLMPIVAIERLLFATGMALAHSAITKLAQQSYTLPKKQTTCAYQTTQ